MGLVYLMLAQADLEGLRASADGLERVMMTSRHRNGFDALEAC